VRVSVHARGRCEGTETGGKSGESGRVAVLQQLRADEYGVGRGRGVRGHLPRAQEAVLLGGEVDMGRAREGERERYAEVRTPTLT